MDFDNGINKDAMERGTDAAHGADTAGDKGADAMMHSTNAAVLDADNKDKDNKAAQIQYTASDIARLQNGSTLYRSRLVNVGFISQYLSMKTTNALLQKQRDHEVIRIAIFLLALLVLVFFSLCFTGAQGQWYPYSFPYAFYTPIEVGNALYLNAYDALASATHAFEPHTKAWIAQNCSCYWAVFERLQVVGVTLICAILLSISGVLYQNVFANPIAGPGMLGASSGVSLGMMLLVALYGSQALSMVNERYIFCYGLGAAILVFVIIAGKKLSGRGKPFDIVTMLLIGSILGQLIGFVVSYMTLFVMDADDYQTFFTISQMLTIDTSAASWITLGVVSVLSIAPIYFLRFKLNILSLSEEEARLSGVNMTRLRAIALIAGAVMMLAAQIHTGAVGMITLLAPFIARGIFGCEMSKQLTGSVLIGMPLLLVCRDITDCIPFVGDGLAIGSVVSVVAVPLFILIVVRGMKGWE